jgi:hypothetical protein
MYHRAEPRLTGHISGRGVCRGQTLAREPRDKRQAGSPGAIHPAKGLRGGQPQARASGTPSRRPRSRRAQLPPSARLGSGHRTTRSRSRRQRTGALLPNGRVRSGGRGNARSRLGPPPHTAWPTGALAPAGVGPHNIELALRRALPHGVVAFVGTAVATRQPDRHIRAGLEHEACERLGSDRHVSDLRREQPRSGDAAGLESFEDPRDLSEPSAVPYGGQVASARRRLRTCMLRFVSGRRTSRR